MPLKLLVRAKVTDVDILVGILADKLLRMFRDRLVCVETGDFWDGCNVRVVLRNLTDEDAEKVIKIAGEVEREHNCPGCLIVDVIDARDIRTTEKHISPPKGALESLISRLKQEFGNKLVHVETGDFWDGCNVRVVLRNLTDEDAEKVIKIAGEVEREHNCPGCLIVDVVSEDEIH